MKRFFLATALAALYAGYLPAQKLSLNGKPGPQHRLLTQCQAVPLNAARLALYFMKLSREW